jgi:two-component system, OmpR family, response regulator
VRTATTSASAPAPVRRPEGGHGSEYVLLVEDDPLVGQFVADLLDDEGFSSILVTNGAAAVTALREQLNLGDLCVVILDMMLPDVDGVGVLRALAELRPSIPVIAVSADHQQLCRAKAAGAEELLPKPFDLDRLVEAVQRHCPHT